MTDLDTVAATLRAFAERAGAARMAALVDRGAETPVSVECVPGEPARCRAGEEEWTLAPGAAALALPDVEPVTPMRADPATGEVHSKLGELEQLARAVRELAGLLPGRSVAVGEFATADPELPLSIAARSGEPIVLGIGERQFAADPGWPPDS
jgi:hypothetical protein